MRLCAIYNVWFDTLDLLGHSIDNILPVVDGVIVIWSTKSNHGHTCDLDDMEFKQGVYYFLREPSQGKTPHENEIGKRNFGLIKAQQLGFTHFIMMDGDEFYEQSAFRIEKDSVQVNDTIGLVCKTKVYIKSPTLTIGYDHTLVPFIHKITPHLKYTLNNRTYPFGIDKNGQPRIDPTRKLNITSGVEWSDITMHHFSYVRKDINMKINNSSANLRRSANTIHEEMRDAKPGYMSKLYHKEIVECENLFNLPVYD